ncbi:MAG TPA: EamA family transporter [Gemmatimonadales bacterium]|nr:EamA family transporter [Gemmatimonadales bacterium]
MTPAAARAARLRVALAFAAIWIIWGSTYLAIAIGIETIPPFVLAAARFLVAGGAMYLYARSRGAPNPTREQWKWAFLLGTMFFLVGNGVVVFVEQRVSSGLTALLVAMVSAWTAVIEWLRPGGEPPTAAVGLGIVLGFAGAALLLIPGEGATSVPVLEASLLAFSTFCWALASVLSRGARLPAETSMIAGAEMLAGGVALTLLALVSGEVGRLGEIRVSGASVAAFLYLIVFGSLVAFTCFAWLLRVSTPAKVSTAGYVNPMVAVFLGWAFHGEELTTRSLVASLVIIIGVALIITGRRASPAASPSGEHPISAQAQEA